MNRPARTIVCGNPASAPPPPSLSRRHDMPQRFRDLGFLFCGSAIAYGFCGDWLGVGVFAAGSILFFALYIREELRK